MFLLKGTMGWLPMEVFPEANSPSRKTWGSYCPRLVLTGDSTSVRGVAQSGSALALGARGRLFKSDLPDWVV